MQDEIVLRNIRDGEEPSKMRRSRSPPIAHPSSRKSASVPVDREGQWFQTDWGSTFVQLLHSKLEKIKDQSNNIEMTKTKGSVCFSCQIKRCRVVLEFPPRFPDEPLDIKIKGFRTRSGSLEDMQWSEKFGHDQDEVEFIDQLVSHMRIHFNR